MASGELSLEYGGWYGWDWEGSCIVPYTTSYDPISNTTTVTLDYSKHSYSGQRNYLTSCNITVTARATDSGESASASASYEDVTNGGWKDFYADFSPTTITVKHSSTAGTKSVTISCSSEIWLYPYGSDLDRTWADGSVNVVVGEYYPASTLTVTNGTLGISQTLTVSRMIDSFTHTITYACGTASGTICTKSSNTIIQWAPPISLASQNASGTSVAVQFTITTYTGDTVLGTKTVSISCAIPESVKPSFTVAVSDAMGYATQMGGYVQTKSKLNVVVNITTMYGASVASVKATVNGETHNTNSFTTGALKTSGNNTISVEVIDSRGRKVSGNTTVAVLAYSAPAISLLTYNRCNSDGTDNVLGDYAEITFSNKVTSLNGKNAISYKLEYKKTSDSQYSTVNMADFAGVYIVTKGVRIFPADSGSSYDVRLTVSDYFSSAVATLVVDTGSAIMHWLPRGVGMAIGKIAEKIQTLELGWKLHMNGNRIEGVGNPVEDQDAVPWKVAKNLHHRNLLDNSYWAIPSEIVNQNRQTSYKFDSGFTIDRWRLHWSGDGGITINNGYITLSRNPYSAYLFQNLPVELGVMGKTLTFAVKARGKGYIGFCFNNGSVRPKTAIDSESWTITTYSMTIPQYSYSDSILNGVEIESYYGSSIDVEWTALYEGEYTAETLPEYQPKGYGAELAKCQLYHRRYMASANTTLGFGCAVGGRLYVGLQIGAMMAGIVPTIEGISGLAVSNTGLGTNNVTDATIQSFDAEQGHITLSVAVNTTLTEGNVYRLGLMAGKTLSFSSDL